MALFFCFQAEDGIRDLTVTGVQTCALPICFEPDCSDEAARLYGGEGFMLTRAEVRNFWAHYLRTAADERDPRACLARADLKGLPPVRFTIAQCDVLAEQNLQMARRLRDAGVRVTSRGDPGATHSFLEAVAISQLAERALQEGEIGRASCRERV